MLRIDAVRQLRLHAGKLQGVAKIDLEKIFGAGLRTLPIQAPDAPIGQHAPLNGLVRCRFHGGQIAEYLVRWCAGVERIGILATI